LLCVWGKCIDPAVLQSKAVFLFSPIVLVYFLLRICDMCRHTSTAILSWAQSTDCAILDMNIGHKSGNGHKTRSTAQMYRKKLVREAWFYVWKVMLSNAVNTKVHRRIILKLKVSNIIEEIVYTARNGKSISIKCTKRWVRV
jgi:hypothetical protein